MGMNAALYFTTRERISDEEREAYKFRLCFAMNKTPSVEQLGGILDVSWNIVELPSYMLDHTFLYLYEVYLDGDRYYGPGHQRGDGVMHLVAVNLLKRMFADCVVFYGDDSGYAYAADDIWEEEMWVALASKNTYYKNTL